MSAADLPAHAYAEVIGEPVSQSKSPQIHGYWLGLAGLNATYRTKPVAAALLGEYFSKRREDPAWLGCNVTMPLKLEAAAFCDRLDSFANALDTVNLVVPEGDELVGYNTDGPGFLEPLHALLRENHHFRMARLIGAGGAARAIALALAKEGFTIVMAGRDRGKALRTLEALELPGEHHAAALGEFAGKTDFSFDDREGCCDLVINATPLGMRGFEPLPFHLSHAPPRSVIYDIVTDPVDTDFLKSARKAGFATIDGRAMLIGQAAASFEKFFGVAPDRSEDARLLDSIA